MASSATRDWLLFLAGPSKMKKADNMNAEQLANLTLAFLLVPQQVSMLASGFTMFFCWPLLSQAFVQFDKPGRQWQSLVQVWACLVCAVAIGIAAKYLAGRPGMKAFALQLMFLARHYAGVKDHQQASSRIAVITAKKAQLVEPRADAAADEDDVYVQKQKAQAAARAAAEARQHLRERLDAVAEKTDLAQSAQQLYLIANQLFQAPAFVTDLLDCGGLAAVVGVLPKIQRAMKEESSSPVVPPALLQVSWVLVQIANGPSAALTALAESEALTHMVALMHGVSADPRMASEAKASILRNIGWVIFTLCDAAWQQPDLDPADADRAQRCIQKLVDAGGPKVFIGQAPDSWSVGSSTFIISTLSSLLLAAEFAGKEPSEEVLKAWVDPDFLHAVVYLLSQRPVFHDRSCDVILHCLQFILTVDPISLLKPLVEQHLVGSLMTAIPPQASAISRLLVCNILNSKGQAMLASIEESYELDVPLALAQIIPSKVHMKLPPPPNTPSLAEDTYTDILTCRLLLQNERLKELLAVFWDSLPTSSPTDGATDTSVQQGTPDSAELLHEQRLVTTAVVDLTNYLMSKQLLQPFEHRRGRLLGSESGATDSFASSTSLCDALMVDEENTYQEVLQGLLQRGDTGSILRYSGSGCSIISEIELLADEKPVVTPAVTDEAVKSCSSVPPLMADRPAQPLASFSEIEPAVDGNESFKPLPRGPHLWANGTSLGGAQYNTSSENASADSSGRSNVPLVNVHSSSHESPLVTGSGRVLFQFGQQEHRMSGSAYKKLLKSSRHLEMMLSRSKMPITSFKISQQHLNFTDEANYWVLCCLAHYTQCGTIQGLGLTPQDAVRLWVAADFLQVDGLQVACEDAMAKHFDDDQVLLLALGLCRRHPQFSARLERLCATALLRNLGNLIRLPLMSAVAGLYRAQCEAPAHDEIRDRLVAVCIRNDSIVEG